MKNKKTILIAWVFLSAASVAGVRADPLLLLLFPPGGRAGALAGAFTSVADDAETVFYNPAGLSATRTANGGIMYTNLGETFSSDAFMVSADLSLPFDNYGAGTGFIFEKLDESGSYDLFTVASCGMKLGKELGLGMGVKYLRSVVEGEGSGSALGFDIGGTLTSGPYSLGISVQNWRQAIDYDVRRQELPEVIRMGISYKDPRTHAPLSIEYTRVDEPFKGSFIRAGVEVPAVVQKLYLRAGYAREIDSGEDSILLGLGIGPIVKQKSDSSGLSGLELNAYDDLRVGGSQDARVELRMRPF